MNQMNTSIYLWNLYVFVVMNKCDSLAQYLAITNNIQIIFVILLYS